MTEALPDNLHLKVRGVGLMLCSLEGIVSKHVIDEANKTLLLAADALAARAALEAKGAPDLSEVPFLIHFDDADCKPRIVIGEAAARHVFKEVSSSWNAHLFVKIASNARDDRYASKNATLAGAPQVAPEPPAGNWIAADDYYRNVRALDVALNGEDGAAARPLLIDVLSQVEAVTRKLGRPLLAPQTVPELPAPEPIAWAPAKTQTGALVVVRWGRARYRTDDDYTIPLYAGAPQAAIGTPAISLPEHEERALAGITAAMAEKLYAKYLEGCDGFEMATAEHLSALLRKHVEKGDPVDVANFCAFLHANGQRIEGAPQAPVGTER